MGRRRKRLVCPFFVNIDMYFCTKIYTKLSPNELWIIAKEDLSKRLFEFFEQVSYTLYENS